MINLQKVVTKLTIAAKIVSLRNEKGWSQRELAERVGLNKSVMNRIELGDRPIKDNELIELARVFGVSTDYLLGLDDFYDFVKDPTLIRWVKKELPRSKESDLKKLQKMWEIIKEDKKED